MKRHLYLPLILISALTGCTQTKEFTVIKLDKLPATGKQTIKRKGIVRIEAKDGKLKPAQYEVIAIGPSVDGSGNLVGHYDYYRIVESKQWEAVPHKPATFPAFKKGETVVKAEDADVIKQARAATEEAQAVTIQLRNRLNAMQQQQGNSAPQGDPVPGGNATAEAPLPLPATEGTSSVQTDIDNGLSPERQQALKTFDQQAQTQ